MMCNYPKWFLLAAAALSLAACASIEASEKLRIDDLQSVRLEAGETVGQTFVARQAGLDGIEIYLSPLKPGGGEIRLHLRADPQATFDLAEGYLPLPRVSVPAFYRFSFAPQRDSRQRYYYVLFELVGEGEAKIGGTTADAYLDGAMYRANIPVEAQMAFRLTYAPRDALGGLALQALSWAGILSVGLLLFLLPGWALLVLLFPRENPLPLLETLGLAVGLSVAFYPVLLLVTDLIRVHLGPLYAWLPLAGSALILLSRFRSTSQPHGGSWLTLKSVGQAWFYSPRRWPDLAFLSLMGLVLLARFVAIRSLELPMWGDAYQHTLIPQLLLNNGGLFNAWAPYAALETLTYHFGFHAAVAILHWVTRMEIPYAVLWAGQILNGLAIFALYPLAARLGRSHWAGVGAVLVAGLLSPMPMFYVNWGRYTQLAGQVILPATIALAWSTLESERWNWRLITLTSLAMGGLALTHYRVVIFGVLFLTAAGLFALRPERVRGFLIKTLGIGVGSGLIFLPWLLHTFAGRITLNFARQLATPAVETSGFTRQYNAIGDLPVFLPTFIWLVLPLIMGWGLWRRQKGVEVFSLWWFLMILAANPQWLSLPGEGAISNFAVLIAAYIPAGVLAGAALGWLIENHPYLHGLPVMVVLLAIGLWGSYRRLSDVRVADHALATRPDVRAGAWIRENTPPSACFLVNSFFAYGDTLIVGSDGGWWLPVLAHRRTNVPPINYVTERGPRPDYRMWINQLSAEINAKGIGHPDVLALLRERGFGYVYIGQRQGRVNYNGLVLDPQQLLAIPDFYPIYHQDRVWIFKLDGVANSCGE